jgi:hypothetical protein
VRHEKVFGPKVKNAKPSKEDAFSRTTSEKLVRVGWASGRLDLVVSVALLLLFFGVYFLNLRHLEPLAFDRIDLLFGADSRHVVSEMRGSTFYLPHVLFAPTTRPLVKLFDALFSSGSNLSVIVVLAGFVAAAVVFAYLTLRRLSLSVVPAVGFTVLYASLFANLVIFSIPETYVLSNLVILTFLFVLVSVKGAATNVRLIYLAAFAGFTGLYNPPLLSLIVLPLLLHYRKQKVYQLARLAFLSGTIAVSIFVVANFLARGTSVFTQFDSMANQWASLSHLLEPESIGLVLSNFFAYAVVSPVEKLRTYLVLSHAGGYFDSWLKGTLILVYAGFFVYVVVASWRKRDSLVLALSVWIAILVIFYLYFNPLESMLYAPQILFPLTMIFAVRFREIGGQPGLKNACLLIFTLLLAWNNFSTLYAPLR